jgi:acetate kinase
MRILVLNSGSSSIKYELFDMRRRRALAAGLLERIGESQSRLSHRSRTGDGPMTEAAREERVADHREGIAKIAGVLAESKVAGDPSDLSGIGHRVVHGGETFREPTRITEDVLERIRGHIPLAPLHNPANLVGIEVALDHWPGVPQVAVFDTAFHHSLPPHAYHYAIPLELYQRHHIRRYGFHGTSHCYVARQAAAYLGQPLESLNLITLHLGNGASITAIQAGRSVDTSMGMTPLEGLIMGTRCGDLDPAVVFHLGQVTGKSNRELESLLNRQSGLKGICGQNDMREILRMASANDTRARLAIEMYAYRIKKYIGAYCAVLGRVDALVFTAGIGENSPDVRARCCDSLSGLGIAVDPDRNAMQSDRIREIQAGGGPVKVLVVPTDEELEIAEETVQCIASGGKGTEDESVR